MDRCFAVITSINPPTEAVSCLAELLPGRVIVVGDRKTPADWRQEGVEFTPFGSKEDEKFATRNFLPVDHYSRKMLGYLRAIESGAEVIFDTDDDNVPKQNWAIPTFTGVYETTESNLGFVNVYSRFTPKRIWPRGFPLRLISDSFNVPLSTVLEPQTIGIWQGLADGEPDVDAIYRLVFGDETNFEPKPPIALGAGTFCPWNSQNTAFSQEFFPLLYLPGFVSFRFTDILRSLVAQPIIWARGKRVGFHEATVTQNRNPHCLVRDFTDELTMYQYVETAAQIALDTVTPNLSVIENLHACYVALRSAGLVPSEELDLLEAWTRDLGELDKPKLE